MSKSRLGSAHDPAPLHTPSVLAIAKDREVAFLELPHNDLPPSCGLVLVDAGVAAVVDRDVGKVQQLRVHLELVRQLFRPRPLDEAFDKRLDVSLAPVLVVGENVTRELLDTLRDLQWRSVMLVYPQTQNKKT